MNQPAIIEFEQQRGQRCRTCLINDLIVVCRYCLEVDNSFTEIRSVLLENIQISANLRQGIAGNVNLSHMRWKLMIYIELYLIGLEPNFWGYRNQVTIIAHAIEYYFFITAKSSEMYNDIGLLHDRCEFILYFMAKRISSFQADTSEMIDNEVRHIIEY